MGFRFRNRKNRLNVESLEERCLLSPIIDWSTYLGGAGDDDGSNISIDSFGDIYVAGTTESSGWVSGGFDTSFNGSSDAFIIKLNSSGQHLWSTYLGGSSWDYGGDITIDGSNIYVTGTTDSQGWVSGGFDNTYGGYTDAFVTKLNSSGQHLWSTYLGGDDFDTGSSIAIEGSNLYITGITASENGWVSGGFDTTYNGGDDAFVAKLNSSGQHLWSSYLGGAGDDYGSDVGIDSFGNIYITANTESRNLASGGFDTSFNGSSDAFIIKLNSSGQHLWSTYLGGSSLDYGGDITIDGSNIYVTGTTDSQSWVSGGFDTTYNGGDDAFVAKLNSLGQHLWSTYLGGAGDDYGSNISVDSSGNIYLASSTKSPDWVSGGFDSTLNGPSDAFVAKLNSSGQHLWSTYLGGSSRDNGLFISLDNLNNIFVGGLTRSNNLDNWIAGGYDTSYNNLDDGFLVKIKETDIKKPVIIVPGTLGSLIEKHSTRTSDVRRFIQNIVFKNGKVTLTPYHPNVLGQEKILNSYKKLVDSFLEKGYSLCDLDNPDISNDSVSCSGADLFFAVYDWRQPVLLNNNKEILWDDDKNTFQSGVEYLDWWIKLSKENWIAKGGQPEDFSVDIIAHSLGGLVARAYIEESEEAGRATEKVDKLIMLATPNHGSVSTHQFLNPEKRIGGGANLSNIIFDSRLKTYLIQTTRNLELANGFKRGTIKSENIVPSLLDIMPTFPYYRDRTLTLPKTNYFLERLNTDITDLTNNTNVLLVGTTNLSTPSEIVVSRRGRLNFLNQPIGDGRVIYDKVNGVDSGQLIQDKNIEYMSILNTKHSDIPKNQEVIDRIFEELTI